MDSTIQWDAHVGLHLLKSLWKVTSCQDRFNCLIKPMIEYIVAVLVTLVNMGLNVKYKDRS